MEERGEDPGPVAFPDVWPAVERAQKSVARDLAVQLCRRGLERLVVATQPPRTAAKLLKGACCFAHLVFAPAASLAVSRSRVCVV